MVDIDTDHALMEKLTNGFTNHTATLPLDGIPSQDDFTTRSDRHEMMQLVD